MADYLNEKDYSDYFRRLEERLGGERSAVKSTIEHKEPEKKPATLKMKKKPIIIAVALVVIMATVIGVISSSCDKKENPKKEPVSDSQKDDVSNIIIPGKADENTAAPTEEITSQHIVMVNLSDRKIVAAREAYTRTSPASTTKIMTALVACENIKNFDDKFKMIIEITDPVFLAGATSAGFSIGEEVTMTDLLYGCILPSGGDAALGLAYKISGNEAEFVKLMNKKVKELGLKDTHFTNVTGLYDAEHYTTAADMAVILEAAMNDPLCRKLMSTFQYTTSKTKQHPEGITLTSTLFSLMYGNEPETATINGGKTGYVNESGFCIASFGNADDGTPYICVTLHAPTRWPAVFDQIELYKLYAK